MIRCCFKKFRAEQEGTASIEFVFLFPVFMFLFLMGFESGYYMVRSVMLERGVEMAVRDVRLGNGKVPNFNVLKQKICAQAGIIPDCVDSLQVEMQPFAIAPGGTTPIQTAVRCVDKLSTDDPITGTTYDVGSENEMMMVRVCSLSQPLFPTTAIGAGLKIDTQGNYAIVSTTAFVNEPGNRAFATVPNGSGNGGLSGGNGNQ